MEEGLFLVASGAAAHKPCVDWLLVYFVLLLFYCCVRCLSRAVALSPRGLFKQCISRVRFVVPTK